MGAASAHSCVWGDRAAGGTRQATAQAGPGRPLRPLSDGRRAWPVPEAGRAWGRPLSGNTQRPRRTRRRPTQEASGRRARRTGQREGHIGTVSARGGHVPGAAPGARPPEFLLLSPCGRGHLPPAACPSTKPRREALSPLGFVTALNRAQSSAQRSFASCGPGRWRTRCATRSPSQVHTAGARGPCAWR